MRPVRAPLPRAALGEAPRYDAATGTLSWVDLPAGQLWLAKAAPDGPAAGWISAPALLTTLPDPLSCAVRTRDGHWLLAAGGAVLHWDPSTGAGAATVLEPDTARARLNDGAVDADGRFWIGSMGVARPLRPWGRLHVLHGAPATGTRVLREGLLAANGIGWSPDSAITYVVDSGTRLIHRLRTDGAAGPLRAAGPPLAVPAGTPDGITVDREGCLWVALWDGGCVVRLSPDGEVLVRVDLPCSRPTACTLVGSRLLVTTATVTGEAGSGWAYAVDVPVGGPPAHRAAPAGPPAPGG
ncbi:SMP-30/gluconolactonase/LRE family protein [Streptomyces sp. NPDC001228]|uniref:SMP-30/gluconolactonase/LRE family protein n=1 Tax=Streptomyces sp. NPDC001228 TaxID=3154381 RepID=UPI003328F2AA